MKTSYYKVFVKLIRSSFLTLALLFPFHITVAQDVVKQDPYANNDRLQQRKMIQPDPKNKSRIAEKKSVPGPKAILKKQVNSEEKPIAIYEKDQSPDRNPVVGQDNKTKQFGLSPPDRNGSLPQGFPRFIDTGNPDLDEENHTKEKAKWIENNNELYKELVNRKPISKIKEDKPVQIKELTNRKPISKIKEEKPVQIKEEETRKGNKIPLTGGAQYSRDVNKLKSINPKERLKQMEEMRKRAIENGSLAEKYDKAIEELKKEIAKQ